MLSKELLKQIKRIELKAGFLASSALSGEYASVFKGSGMEFEKVREYLPGDDVRSIDWNVTARMQEPFVKVYKEEREMTLMIAVDVSASLGFGSSSRFKEDAALECAAALAFLASKNNDKVGVVLFSDHVETFVPPKKGRAHIFEIIKTILEHKRVRKGTSLNHACEFLLKILKRKSMCFIISDFEGTKASKSFNVLAKKHDMSCVRVYDPREEDPSSCGFIHAMDAETEEIYELDTADYFFQKNFKKEAAQRSKELSQAWNKLGVFSFELSTEDAIASVLLRYMHDRERGRL